MSVFSNILRAKSPSLEPDLKEIPLKDLEAMKRPINIKEFMGRWFVHAHIPSFIDMNTINNIEDYTFDEDHGTIDITFHYTTLNSDKTPHKHKSLKQQAQPLNAESTEWSMSLKYLIYWPVKLHYLLLAVNEGEGSGRAIGESTYTSCMVGVPDRSLLWIMSRRRETISGRQLNAYLMIAERLGYVNVRDSVKRVPFGLIPDNVAPLPKPVVSTKESISSVCGSDTTSLSEETPGAPGLRGMKQAIDIEQFMGRWFVHAHIPSFFDKGTINNIEDYSWDPVKEKIHVTFRYTTVLRGSPGPVKLLQQSARLTNDAATEWSMAIKVFVYWPMSTKYLLLAVNEGESAVEGFVKSRDNHYLYNSAMVGVPDRSMLWIMSRNKDPISEMQLEIYTDIAEQLGYENAREQVKRVGVDWSLADPDCIPFGDNMSPSDSPLIRGNSGGSLPTDRLSSFDGHSLSSTSSNESKGLLFPSISFMLPAVSK